MPPASRPFCGVKPAFVVPGGARSGLIDVFIFDTMPNACDAGSCPERRKDDLGPAIC